MSQLKFYILPLIAYLIVANPGAHKATRSVLGNWVSTPDGTAKLGGLLLHGVVFVLLVSFLMRLFPRDRSYYDPMQARVGPGMSDDYPGKGGDTGMKPMPY